MKERERGWWDGGLGVCDMKRDKRGKKARHKTADGDVS